MLAAEAVCCSGPLGGCRQSRGRRRLRAQRGRPPSSWHTLTPLLLAPPQVDSTTRSALSYAAQSPEEVPAGGHLQQTGYIWRSGPAPLEHQQAPPHAAHPHPGAPARLPADGAGAVELWSIPDNPRRPMQQPVVGHIPPAARSPASSAGRDLVPAATPCSRRPCPAAAPGCRTRRPGGGQEAAAGGRPGECLLPPLLAAAAAAAAAASQCLVAAAAILASSAPLHRPCSRALLTCYGSLELLLPAAARAAGTPAGRRAAPTDPFPQHRCRRRCRAARWAPRTAMATRR